MSASSTDRIELEPYFERIGYDGPRTASLETLRALHVLHPAAIPFENLSPFSGAEVKLELASLVQKLVFERRGGYCFEHNLLLLAALRALGFRANGLAARVLWNQPEDAITARGHMLVRVELDTGTYIADAGFGRQTLTAPLRLEAETVQSTPHEPFRLVREADGDFRLQAQTPSGWRTLYRFDLSPAFLSDYEVSNYYLSTHPRSHFRTGLIASRAVPGKRYGLSGSKLSVHPLGAEPELRSLSTPKELRDVLNDVFGIRVPETEALERALASLF